MLPRIAEKQLVVLYLHTLANLDLHTCEILKSAYSEVSNVASSQISLKGGKMETLLTPLLFMLSR